MFVGVDFASHASARGSGWCPVQRLSPFAIDGRNACLCFWHGGRGLLALLFLGLSVPPSSPQRDCRFFRRRGEEAADLHWEQLGSRRRSGSLAFQSRSRRRGRRGLAWTSVDLDLGARHRSRVCVRACAGFAPSRLVRAVTF